MYKIAGWSDLYETHESRKLKKLAWVAVPNNHDSLGYRKITREPDACELFAAWVLILQVASKASSVNVRGTLQNGATEYSPEDLADMTGFPASIFARAFSFFASERVKWLEPITCGYIQEKSAGVPGESAGTPGKSPDTLHNITGHNITGHIFCGSAGAPGENPGTPGESAGTPGDNAGKRARKAFAYSPEFEEAWKAWPSNRKGEKGAAFKAWNKCASRPPLETILASIEAHKQHSAKWLDGFNPEMVNWINDRGFDTDPTPISQPKRYLPNGDIAL